MSSVQFQSGANNSSHIGPLGFSQGTIDITPDPGAGNYTITDKVSTSTKMSVPFISPITLSATPVSVFMMILVGTQETARIEITSNGTLKTFTKTPPAGGFMSGQKYVVTLDEVDFETAT